MILREKLAGTPGSSACTSRCPDMTTPAPAAMPAWNGGRSSASSAARLCVSTGSAVVAVDGGVAVAGEVLDRGGDAGATAGPGPRRRPGRRRRRVGAERAGADHGVARGPEHVGVRREVELMPIAASSSPAAAPGGLGELRLARPRRSAIADGQLRTPGRDPGDPAVLLVGADQQRRPAGQLAAPRPAGRRSARGPGRVLHVGGGLVAPVGSSGAKPTRIRPPRRYLATISAGVSTPASAGCRPRGLRRPGSASCRRRRASAPGRPGRRRSARGHGGRGPLRPGRRSGRARRRRRRRPRTPRGGRAAAAGGASSPHAASQRGRRGRRPRREVPASRPPSNQLRHCGDGVAGPARRALSRPG